VRERRGPSRFARPRSVERVRRLCEATGCTSLHVLVHQLAAVWREKCRVGTSARPALATRPLRWGRLAVLKRETHPRTAPSQVLLFRRVRQLV
jgi:hypothetical protein